MLFGHLCGLYELGGQLGINMLLNFLLIFFKARISLYYYSLSLKQWGIVFQNVLLLIIFTAFIFFEFFWPAVVCFQVQVMLHLRLPNRMLHPITHATDFGRKQMWIFSQKLICLFEQKFKVFSYYLKNVKSTCMNKFYFYQ